MAQITKITKAEDNKNRTNPRAKAHGICRAVFGIENCRTKVRGIKPTIFNKQNKQAEDKAPLIPQGDSSLRIRSPLRIRGLQKVSLIDYTPYTCCVVFLGGCNFRCGFCQNPDLVIDSDSHFIPEKEFFGFLEERKRWIDGVCITGGEPSLHSGLPSFIRKIKEMGYKVKLDTNGTNPAMLKEILASGLVDYIAMDIKGSLREYDKIANVKVDKKAIKKSIALIMKSGTGYEFRTTIIPRFHREEEILSIGKWLKGSKRFVLQQFRNEKVLDLSFKDEVPYPPEELQKFRKLLLKFIKEVGVRD